MKNKNVLVFSLLLFIAFVGCNSKKKGTGSVTISASDTVKYLAIKDAEEFLPSWSRENTLVYQVAGEPELLNPVNSISSAPAQEIFFYTQNTLVREDLRTNELMPVLVNELPKFSPDGLQLTFELSEVPHWDNSDALSVDDITFTIKANKCPLVDNLKTKSFWDNIKNVKTFSENKKMFTVEMRKPDMNSLIMWSDFPILQRKFYDNENVFSHFTMEQLENDNVTIEKDNALKTWAKDFNGFKYGRDVEFLNGLGAYKVSDWDDGLSITLTKKSNHWSRSQSDEFVKAFPEKIIFQLNKEPFSQELGFKKQSYDVSTSVSTGTLIKLQSDSIFNANYNSQFMDTYSYTYLGMNLSPSGKHKKIFIDKKVRRAIALLIPIEQINHVINEGKGKRQVGPVSYLKVEFNTELKPVPYDIEQAKKLLVEAGWKLEGDDKILSKSIDGVKTEFEFELNCFPGFPFQTVAEMVAETLKKVGINANINPLISDKLYALARAHDFDMLLGIRNHGSHTEDFEQVWSTKNWQENGSNYVGFGNAQTDALIDSVKTTMNDSARIILSKKFQQIVYDEQPCVFLFANLKRVIVHKRFGNQEFYFPPPGVLLNNLKLLSDKNSTVN